MKKLLYLTALITGVSYGAFRSDYITATSSMTTPKMSVSTVATTSGGTSIYFASATTGISLSEIEDLTANKVFTMANKTLEFQFTNPAGGIKFDYTGAFSGHAFELLQETGNPGADTHMLHIEASDVDVVPLHLAPANTSLYALEADGILKSSGVYTSTGIFISSITSPGINVSTISGVTKINFADGTSQTSAASAGGITAGSTTTWTGTNEFTSSTSIKGTTTNNNAAAGYIGEYKESAVTTWTNTGTSGTWWDATSLALTPGDWIVCAQVAFYPNGATFSETHVGAGISTNSGNNGAGQVGGQAWELILPTTWDRFHVITRPVRISIASSTTYYLKGSIATFTGGPPWYNAWLTAWRIR